MKTAYQRSIQSATNNATQAFAASGTQINILGSLICDTGCSVTTSTSGFRINRSGVYRISADVTVTPSAAGTVTLQMANGSSILPCASASESVAENGIATLHVETTIPVQACQAIHPEINLIVGGVQGSVTHVCASVIQEM